MEGRAPWGLAELRNIGTRDEGPALTEDEYCFGCIALRLSQRFLQPLPYRLGQGINGRTVYLDDAKVTLQFVSYDRHNSSYVSDHINAVDGCSEIAERSAWATLFTASTFP